MRAIIKPITIFISDRNKIKILPIIEKSGKLYNDVFKDRIDYVIKNLLNKQPSRK